MTDIDRRQERMLESIPRHCEHCTEGYDLRGVPCDRGDLPPHCERHREECARCHTIFCYKALKENEDGEKLCEECTQIEAEPQIQAARRAAHTGSHSALQTYLRLRKGA